MKAFIRHSFGDRFLREHTGAFCIIALVISVGLYPALSGRFAFHNDLLFLAPLPWDFPKWGASFIETQHLFNIGRPIGALLISLQAFFIKSLDAMLVSRIVSALLVVFSAAAMYLFLARQHVPQILALGFAVVIALLPPFQLYVAWSTNLIPGSLVIALVCAGYLWLEFIWQENPKKLPKKNIMASTAVLLFLVMMIYPPTALYGLVFTAARLTLSSSPRRIVWELVLRDIAIYAMAMIIYFLYTKTLVAYAPAVPLSAENNPLSSYETGLVGDLYAKLHYFTQVLYTVLSLSLGVLSLGGVMTATDPASLGLDPTFRGMILTSPEASYYTIAAGAIGWLAISCTHLYKKSLPISSVIVSIMLLSAIFMMSMAPSLLAHGNILAVRIFAAPEAIWLIVLLAPLAYLYEHRSMAVKIVLTGIVLSQMALSFYNLHRTVLHCEREYSLFKQALYKNGDHQSILIVMRPRWSQIIDPPLPLEFGLLGLGGNLGEGRKYAIGLLKSAAIDTGSHYAVMDSGHFDSSGMFNTGDGYSYELIWTDDGYNYVLRYHKKTFEYWMAGSFNNYSIPIDFAGGGDDPIDYHKLLLLGSVSDVLLIDVNKAE